ncbi:MAG: hypothetical protein IJ767_03140 [Bacteroidaceae bacterium]|nr:hypothetical protein [Bacteroidaceae bacterium]
MAPILDAPVIWLKPLSQIGMVVSLYKSYHRRKTRQWFEGERCLRGTPSFRENKYGRKLQKMVENGVELKPIVFALFSQNEKSAT